MSSTTSTRTERSDPEAAGWFQAAEADNVPGMVEYAIMLFNGEGTPRTRRALRAGSWKAAQRGNPVAQNRAAPSPGRRRANPISSRP